MFAPLNYAWFMTQYLLVEGYYQPFLVWLLFSNGLVHEQEQLETDSECGEGGLRSALSGKRKEVR